MRRDLILHRPGTLLGGLNIALGLVLLGGSPTRTSSFSFAVARDIAPIRWWGLGFLLGGLLCLWAGNLRHWGVAALMVGAGIHTFWAVAFLTAAIQDNRAALTGIPVYMFLALLHLLTGLRLAQTPTRRAG